MKTKILLLTALPLALMAAGCGNKQSDNSPTPAAEQPAPGTAVPKNERPSPDVNTPATNTPAPTNSPATVNP